MAGAMPGWMTQFKGLHWAAMACTVAIAAACCAAQEPAATYPVRGVVENSVTHQPIARALVEVDAAGNRDVVLTDSDGHFELSLPEGGFAILIRRPGYGQGMDLRREVKVSADTPAVTFYLSPQASITGHVSLSGGDEADGLRFFIFRKQSNEGHVRWVQMGMTATDSGGDFRFVELDAPASYVLCSDPSPDDARAVTYGYPSICFPGGTDFSSAASAPLTLSPGQAAEVDIGLTRQRFYRVSIATANLPQGQGASIEIHNQGSPQTASAMQRSMQPSTVAAELPNGNYYAEARIWGRTAEYGRVDFKVSDGPIPGLIVNPQPLQPLMVEVHKEFTASNSNFNGRLNLNGGWIQNDDNPGMNLTLIPADSLFENPFSGNLHRPEGSADRDLFEMDEVKPGRYWVRADSFQTYVNSITSGSTDLAREPLTIGPGGSSAPIEITLRNDTGEIECKVDSGANAASAAGPGSGEIQLISVYAIPQFAHSGRIAEILGAPIGNFGFPNLAPGLYSVIAVNGNHEIDTDDPDELARISARGKTVSVEAGGAVQVQLSPIESGEESASQ